MLNGIGLAIADGICLWDLWSGSSPNLSNI